MSISTNFRTVPRPDRLERPVSKPPAAPDRTEPSPPAGLPLSNVRPARLPRVTPDAQERRPVTLPSHYLGNQLAATSGQSSQHRPRPAAGSTWGTRIVDLPNGGTLTTTTTGTASASTTERRLEIPGLAPVEKISTTTVRELPNGGNLTITTSGTASASTVERRLEIPSFAPTETSTTVRELPNGGTLTTTTSGTASASTEPQVKLSGSGNVSADKSGGIHIQGAKAAAPDSLLDSYLDEAESFLPDAHVDLNRGVIDGAIGVGNSAWNVVSNPRDAAKAFQALSSNPFLNPRALVTDWIFQGQNPIDNIREGMQQNQQIASGLTQSYRDQYRENGVAGLIGLIGFEVGLALATGGTAQAATGATKAARVAQLARVVDRVENPAFDVIDSARPED